MLYIAIMYKNQDTYQTLNYYNVLEKPWSSKKKFVKNQTFTEGWIEFEKKRHAKAVAQMLNNKPVGGKKSKEYHDHLWNIKYLRG